MAPSSSRKETKACPPVAAKYKNHIPGETWSDCGAHAPFWVKQIMHERGWTLEELKMSAEFMA